MKRLLALLVALTATALAHAAAGPIRVLQLGDGTSNSTRRAHFLMRDLGRDAIWFDYTADARVVTPEWIAKFDAVLLDAPKEDFKALAGVDAKKLVTPPAGDDNKALVQSVRDAVLVAVGDARKKDWEAFLAQREPEKRTPNPNVANYERRAEALTFVGPLSVKGSKERTQVAPDLRLELFAAEPDIAKPIAFAWDERGRCWVAETRDYPHDVKRTGEGNDSIKICEDTDGDGKADKFTVFADKMNIPTSLVFVNGGIIVSQPPRFLFLKDTNGDDKADVREELLQGWGIGDTHAQANNLHYGHDNWIYGCVGYSGFNGRSGREAIAVRAGHVSFQGRRLGARIPASVLEQLVGPERERRGRSIRRHGQWRADFLRRHSGQRRAARHPRRECAQDQRRGEVPHHHAELPAGGRNGRLHGGGGQRVHLLRARNWRTSRRS